MKVLTAKEAAEAEATGQSVLSIAREHCAYPERSVDNSENDFLGVRITILRKNYGQGKE